jgi:hypothetical protein
MFPPLPPPRNGALSALRSLLCCVAFLASLSLPAAPDFWLTATTTQAPKKVLGEQALVLRELARQAVVLAALHETGQTPGDEVFDAYRTDTSPALPRLRLNAPWENNSVTLTLALDEPASTVGPLELHLDAAGAPHERPEALARSLAPLIAGPISGWLRTAIPAAHAIAPAASDLSAESLLWFEAHPDPVNCFELLRHWHGVARTTPAPEAFAGLARAYTLLAESTRHHWSALSSACTARALLYCELLRQRYPDHPSALETHAWVYGLGGYHAVAQRDLDALAARGNVPAWHPLLDTAVRYQTDRLIRHARAGDQWSPLAAWLVLISVENQRTPNLYQRYLAEFAPLIPHNPRPLYAANHVFGVGGLHHSTMEGLTLAPGWLSQHLLTLPGLPSTLRDLATPEANASAIRAFALASQELPDDGYPAWGTLGRILWDTQFAFTADRLHFMAYMWGVSTEEEIAGFAPLFTGHPYASALATLLRNDSGRVDQSAAFARVRIGDAVEGMADYLGWAKRESTTFADLTTTQAWNQLWYAANGDMHAQGRLSLESDSNSRRRETPDRLANSPANPAVNADAIRFLKDWQTRLATAQKLQPDHPLIAAAAGERLLASDRAPEAIPFLKLACRELGEATGYSHLADAYLKVGDEPSWLATRLAFNELPDAGLAHARNSLQIANHYLATHRPALAVPHAENAAESWAAWAMESAAFVQAVAGNHDRARLWLERDAERYGDKLADRIIWHALAGYGDREALITALRADKSQRGDRPRDFELLGLATEARDRHLENYDGVGDNYSLLLAGLTTLELGDTAKARELFTRLPAEFSKNRTKDATRVANHRLASVFLADFETPLSDEEFTTRVNQIIHDQGLDRAPLDRYAPDLLYMASRYLRLRLRPAASDKFLTAAAEHPTNPDPGRYVFPLIALEFHQHGRDLLAFYRQAPAPTPAPAN